MKNLCTIFNKYVVQARHIPAKLLGSKVPGGCCQKTDKPVQMFKMAESDGAFACLNTSSSRQGLCQNTPGGGGTLCS